MTQKEQFVLICECGWEDHPSNKHPTVWLTPEITELLTPDHPVVPMSECSECGYDVYLMRKCICKKEPEEEIDEAMELILTIVNDETNWKDKTTQLNKFSPEESQTDILNVEGVLRVRITDALKYLTTEE